MAAGSVTWGAVWGWWLALWVITVAALVTAIGIAGTHWIVARRRRWTRRRIQGTCFHLQDQLVMDLYKLGGFGALERVVEERKRRKIGVDVPTAGLGADGRGGLESETNTVIKYTVREESITVIRAIVADLEDANDIVYGDLIGLSLEPGRALDRALSAAHGREEARLGKLDTTVFLSIRGRFRETASTVDEITFSAPYGDPADPTGQPRVSVRCKRDQLRHDVPLGPFPARCLGKILGWNDARRELEIDPLAIFQ